MPKKLLCICLIVMCGCAARIPNDPLMGFKHEPPTLQITEPPKKMPEYLPDYIPTKEYPRVILGHPEPIIEQRPRMPELPPFPFKMPQLPPLPPLEF